MGKRVKRENQVKESNENVDPVRTKVSTVGPEGSPEDGENQQEDASNRRVLRSKYHAMITKINDSRDEISSLDSNKFNIIINEVDILHKQVSKPREQVADAEALLDLANTLTTSVKSISCEGISLAEYVNCLVRQFGKSNKSFDTQENEQITIDWKDIGMQVSPFFRSFEGLCTMLGPMKNELKQKKPMATRKQAVRPTDTARPEEVEDIGAEEKTDTDKNMAMMFEILRRKKQVKLENLILNRSSFAQTVENLFALSFLVKDGRAEIAVDESGFHLVSPKNAPDAKSITKREATYNHFVFRFDFKDWKLMMNAVPVGEELMPHREESHYIFSQAQLAPENSVGSITTTPIRKLSRNRGLVIQESTVEDSPEINDASKGPGIRRCRRRIN